jgi:ABC-type Fe3+ transport system permease subunit
MSEKELGRALLELDSQKLAGVPDAREQTWRVLERDRRRVWRWTALTIALWSSAIVMVLLMLVAYGLVFPLQAKLRQEEQVARLGLTPQQQAEAQFKAQVVFQMITVGVTVSVGLTCFAILSSVFLGLASRRATLRQINASLLEISNQLKELRQASTAPAEKTK